MTCSRYIYIYIYIYKQKKPRLSSLVWGLLQLAPIIKIARKKKEAVYFCIVLLITNCMQAESKEDEKLLEVGLSISLISWPLLLGKRDRVQ